MLSRPLRVALVGAPALAVVEASGVLLLGDWVAQVKNLLFIAIAVLAAAVFLREGRWRELRQPVDLAVLVFVGIALLSAVLNSTPAEPVALGIFVYLRAAALFYGWRALRPAPDLVASLCRGGLWVGLAVAGLAVVQLLLGEPAFAAVGRAGTRWSDEGRALGIFDHPNDLGHFLGILLLLAVCLHGRRPTRRHAVELGVLTAGLLASNSRESWAAIAMGLVILAIVKSGLRRSSALAGIGLVALITVELVASPVHRSGLVDRLMGVKNAVAPSNTQSEPAATPSKAAPSLPAGTAGPGPQEGTAPATPSMSIRQPSSSARPPAESAPPRETRLLLFEQGLDIYQDHPVLGVGPGRFGGNVAAVTNSPVYRVYDFRFYGLSGTQVESFWLHLLVELGTMGFAAYVCWIALLFVGSLKRRRPAAELGPAAVATLTLAAVVSLISPALEDPLTPVLLFTLVGMAWQLACSPGTGGTTTAQRQSDNQLRRAASTHVASR
jgi:O-antigen ligase